MRSLSCVIVLAACSSKPPVSLAMLVPDDATAVSVWRPMDLPILSMIDRPPEIFRCWRELEQKIEVAYQVFTADKSSFVILAGDLPRAKVQPCVDDMLIYSKLLAEDLRDEAGQLVVDTKLGLLHTGWRDHFVVIGRPADVTRALAANSPSKAWAAAIDELPGKSALATTSLAAISHDSTFAGIVGVPTTSWTLVFDSPARPWPTKPFVDTSDALEKYGKEQERKAQGLPPEEPPPEPEHRTPTFRGRVELYYASAADARRAAEAFTRQAFAFELETNLSLALSKLPQKLADTTLTIEFTQDSFPGVELEKLQAWLARAQAAAGALPPK